MIKLGLKEVTGIVLSKGGRTLILNLDNVQLTAKYQLKLNFSKPIASESKSVFASDWRRKGN